jgi:catechol 2,3-dioxygenase-like lactoylglutathione lyase family enzyme
MWALHHVNIATPHVRRTVDFFETVFGMKEQPFPFEIENRGVFVDTEDFVAFFEDGPRQIHVCQPMPELPRDNGFCLNPLLHGHVAITVPDITEIRRRLDRLGVYVADAGRWAYKGYYQIYCYDPALNVVEINSPGSGRLRGRVADHVGERPGPRPRGLEHLLPGGVRDGATNPPGRVAGPGGR